MSEGFPSCSISCADADVTGLPERRVERVSTREQEVAQNVLMTYAVKLQDALQETVVVIGDVIRVQASEMRKNTMHGSTRGTRSTQQWQTCRRTLTTTSSCKPKSCRSSTKRGNAWHDERAAAAEQLAGFRLEQVESQVKQLPEWIKSEIRAEAPDAIVAKTGVDELHDDESVSKSREDGLQDRMHLAAMVTAADTDVTKQHQAVMIDHNIQLQTEELQKFDEARERAWHVERAAAAAQQLADEQTNEMQLEKRLTAHVDSTIESRAARWNCWAKHQDAWDTDRAKMTEEAKPVLKQHTESLKDLVAQNSRIGWAELSELVDKAEECETDLKLQREELDKLDGMICGGFQDTGDDCDSLRARLQQVESQVKELVKISCMMMDPVRKPGEMSCTTRCISPLPRAPKNG